MPGNNHDHNNFNLPNEILAQFWHFLPNRDVVRCERVCKIWQESIKVWAKKGLKCRFGYIDVGRLPEDGNGEDNDVIFPKFKMLSRREKSVQDQDPTCTYIIPESFTWLRVAGDVAVWATHHCPKSIHWTRLNGEGGVVSSRASEVSITQMELHEYLEMGPSLGPPRLRDLHVNKNGIIFAEFECLSDIGYDYRHNMLVLYALCEQKPLAHIKILYDELEHPDWKHRILSLGDREAYFRTGGGRTHSIDIAYALEHDGIIDPEASWSKFLKEQPDADPERDAIKAHFLYLSSGDFVLTEKSTASTDPDYETEKWEVLRIGHVTCGEPEPLHLSIMPRLFPGNPRRIKNKVHTEEDSDIVVIESVIPPGVPLLGRYRSNSVYHIFEMFHVSKWGETSSFRVRVLRCKCPEYPGDPDADDDNNSFEYYGVLLHQPFALLTVSWDPYGYDIPGSPQMVDLEALEPPPEIVAEELGEEVCSLIDEYYECHFPGKPIMAPSERPNRQAKARKITEESFDRVEIIGEGCLKLRKKNELRTRRTCDTYLMKF